jgi:hypothetical protein
VDELLELVGAEELLEAEEPGRVAEVVEVVVVVAVA